CKPGFFVSGGVTTQEIILTGESAFSGCARTAITKKRNDKAHPNSAVNECNFYGFSGNLTNAVSCTENDVDKRKITCADGYTAQPGDQSFSILNGNTSFGGELSFTAISHT